MPQARRLLSVTLPARRRDAAAMLDYIQEIQRRNYAAARSHRKRRLRLLRLLLDSS